MKLPRVEEIHQIDLPFEIEGMIFKKDSNFSLITSAITQPDIQLYPSFSIKGDIWRYQRGNALVEVIDGKENIHKCLEDECQRAWLINFVSVHDEIRPILGVKDKYIYEGEQFSFFGKRLNVAFLKENSKTVLFFIEIRNIYLMMLRKLESQNLESRLLRMNLQMFLHGMAPRKH